jgi:cytochrome c oxidase subunit II
MQKWIFFVLFIGAAVLGIGVLFQDISKHAAEDAAAKADAGKSLKIIASNWQFDKPEYTVAKGETLKVSLTLKEGVHAVDITGQGLDVKLTKDAPMQQVTFDKPGTYEIHCVLPCGQGHANMMSKITVS